MFRLIITLLLLIPLNLGGPATAQIKLKPYKDKLFAYPKVIEKARGGAYLNVAYDKQRDIYGRDTIPLRKAKSRYVTEGLGWSRRVRKYKSSNRTFKYFSIGRLKGGAKVTVIYVHGQGGNRFQGVNDWTFGGNFNRLQVLMKKNGGLLLTPEFTDFKERGTQDIATLMSEFKRRSKNTKMIIACGSMGGGICWRLAKNPKTAAMMDGMFILGSHWHDDFLLSKTAKKGGKKVPIFFGHGSWDTIFKPEIQRGFYEKILRQTPDYPARFVMFDTGNHGTPIRMVDWRRELNWMLSISR